MNNPSTGGRFNLGQIGEAIAKAAAAVAGLAVLVYIAGGLALVTRTRLGVPWDAVLPLIPRERLAALGIAALVITLVLAGLMISIALRVNKARSRWAWAALAVPVLLVLLAPTSTYGLLYIVVIALATVGIALDQVRQRVLRLVGVVLALVLAGATTYLSQLEFQRPLRFATVTLKPGNSPYVPSADVTRHLRRTLGAQPYISLTARAGQEKAPRIIAGARVIEAASDQVLLAYESPEHLDAEAEIGARIQPVLLLISRDQVEGIAYGPSNQRSVVSDSNSVFQALFGHAVPLMCLIPACEWDSTSDVEHDEPAIVVPFVYSV